MDRRFYCENDLVEGDSVTLSAEESRHLKTVLRASIGESISLMDGRGIIADADIVDLGGKRGPATCLIQSVVDYQKSSRAINLFVAPPRGKGMNGIVRMATEMGVASITPIICKRGTGRPDPKSVSGWKATAITAIKQSKNPFLPNLCPPISLSDALATRPVPGIVGWVPTDSHSPAADLADSGQVSLFIGPEGGFEPGEIQAILDAGIQPASFGPWVLRVETAVVAGLATLNIKVQS